MRQPYTVSISAVQPLDFVGWSVDSAAFYTIRRPITNTVVEQYDAPFGLLALDPHTQQLQLLNPAIRYAWLSPDRQHIFGYSTQGNGYSAAIYALDGLPLTAPQPVLAAAAYDYYLGEAGDLRVAWSNDSTQAVFTDQWGSLWLANIDGRVYPLASGLPLPDFYWSPDDLHLLVQSNDRAWVVYLPKSLAPGAPLTLASLRMIDASTGWAIEANGNLVRTGDGGLTWRNVSPSLETYTFGSFYALDANTAWVTPLSIIRTDEKDRLIPYTSLYTWRTTDGGRSWQKSQSVSLARNGFASAVGDYTTDIQFIDRNSGWLLVNVDCQTRVTCGWQLYQTSDGGMNWVRVSDSEQTRNVNYLFDVVFLDESIGWGAGSIIGWTGPFESWNASLFQTSDGGRTWQDVSIPQPSNLSAMLEGDGLDCGSIGLDYISREAIGVVTTCMVYLGNTYPRYNFYHLASSNGQTWHAWLSTGNENFINATTGWRLIDNGAGMYALEQTRDGGVTWSQVKTVMWSGRLDFVSEQEGWAIAHIGEATALLHTTDGGQSWEEIKPVVAPSVEFIDLTSMSMVDETRGWAWAKQPDYTFTLLHTTDGGQTWSDVSPEHLDYGGYFLDARTAWVILGDPTTYTITLARTLDGGQTWSAFASPTFPFSADLVFRNTQDGWATTYDVGAGQAHIGMYQTHDGGVAWSRIMLGNPPDAFPPAIEGMLHLCNICGDRFYYDPQRMIVIDGDLASDPVGSVRLSISTDLGQSWRDLTLPLPDSRFADGLVSPQSPIFFDENEGLLPIRIVKYNSDWSTAYSVLAMYATHDGGLSWTPSPAVVENVASYPGVNFVSPQDAFVACGNDLCVTHDGAQTWQTLASNLVFAYAEGVEYVNQFDFVSTTTGWAITNLNDQARLWKTTDGGATWVEVRPVVVR